jgi:magnesium-transporting ATPase (P-type)
MRQANLAIARRSSSQAALSTAEILLLEDSPQVLQAVLYRGQRIVNGLLDILKLSLTQVTYLTLLILAVTLLTIGFPYQAKQGGLVNVLTVTLPAIGLSLFSAAGVLPTTNLGRLLARFVAPAAITMSAAALAVYVFFLSRTGEVAYAQLTLIYTLVITGLLLVVFIRPPWQPRLGGITQSGDWRPTAMILILMALFLLLAGLPIMGELFAVVRLPGCGGGRAGLGLLLALPLVGFPNGTESACAPPAAVARRNARTRDFGSLPRSRADA